MSAHNQEPYTSYGVHEKCMSTPRAIQAQPSPSPSPKTLCGEERVMYPKKGEKKLRSEFFPQS
jgi:hypothetical protein